MQSAYSKASADWATRTLIERVLPLCRDAVGIFYSLSRLGHQDTYWESLTPLQRCSRHILQPQPTGPPGHLLRESYPSAEMQSAYSTASADWATRTLIERVLPLCRDAVGIFYSLSRLGHQDTYWESLTPLQRCSRHILQPQPTGPPGHLLRESYPSAEMQSAYSTVSADWATRTLIERVLPFCRDAVGIFYSLSRLGHQDTYWESLTPLQRCSRHILQPQPTGPPGHLLRESYPSAEMQSAYSTASADWATRTLIERVLPLCRDAVGIFYSLSRLGHQDTYWESLTPLQRCSRHILQPQPTGPPGHLLRESYPSAEMQSAYSTASADWATRTLIERVLPSLQRCSRRDAYSTASADWATRTLIERVLPLCRDAVGIFYSLSRLGHQDTYWESLTPLQRCSRHILQPQPTGPPGHLLRDSYPSAEMQSAYSTASADWAHTCIVVELLSIWLLLFACGARNLRLL